MKITVDFSESELKEIMRLSGEKKKGPAVRKFVVSELQLRRRREITQQLLAGKVSAHINLSKTTRDLDVWQS